MRTNMRNSAFPRALIVMPQSFLFIYSGILKPKKIAEASMTPKGDFKNNASISLINVYRLSKADLLLKLILRYVFNVFLASCQVSSL